MNMVAARVEGGRIVAEGLSLNVPARFDVTEGQAVTLGLRPIDVQRAAPGEAGAMEALVEVAEYLGNEALLDIRVGPHEMVAEVPASDRAEPGATVHVRLNASAMHLFDTASGRTLAREA